MEELLTETETSQLCAHSRSQILPQQAKITNGLRPLIVRHVYLATQVVQMKLFDLDGSAGTFMINDGHFGFEGACQCTFTEGGFFGGVLTTDLDGDGTNDDPQENGFVEGQLMTFRVERRGSTFSFYASELRVHTYSTDVPVTSIGFRPHRATFQIYDWQLYRHL
eukprot:SAG31_NODE_12474_length_939_cov_0.980952_2_plen_165_part_00